MRTTPVGCGDRVQAHRGRARHSGGPGSGRMEQGTDALRSVPIHQPRDRVADKAAGDTLSGIPAPGVAPRIQQRLIDALIHAVTVRVRSFRKGCMGGLFDLPDGPAARGVAAMADLSVFERTFPARVAVLMRSQPITGAIVGANRQEWPAGTCDIATFALAAIDLVVAEQGFEEEATYDEVVNGLAGLTRRNAPDRPAAEHRRVGEYAVDALLNRGEREAPFT